MVKAVVSNGEIRPLESLPAEWHEGQALRIETAEEVETPAADGSLPDEATPPPLQIQTITAKFEDGVLKPAQPLNLPAHAEVRVTIEHLPASPLTVGELHGFLRNLPPLGDDAEEFSQDVRAIRAQFPVEANTWD